MLHSFLNTRFQNLEMATIEITVTSQFSFEPDSVYLLEGAKIHMKVVEVYGNKKNGKLN